MRELIGKKIVSISINGEQNILSFTTNRGEVAYFTENDCAEPSWFVDILGVKALIGGTVTAVRCVNMDGYNVDDGRNRQERDREYGWIIITDKGYADIVFRNSVHGNYYGGWLEVYEGKLPEDMKAITEDWQA